MTPVPGRLARWVTVALLLCSYGMIVFKLRLAQAHIATIPFRELIP